MFEKIWKWIDHNRFFVIGPIIVTVLWFYASSCTPLTSDPISPARLVNARQLQHSFETWQIRQQVVAKQFEFAGEDLEQQAADNKKIEQLLVDLAGANIADLPGLIQLLIGGGGLGAIVDNIRKRGLISGLKRNKKE